MKSTVLVFLGRSRLSANLWCLASQRWPQLLPPHDPLPCLQYPSTESPYEPDQSSAHPETAALNITHPSYYINYNSHTNCSNEIKWRHSNKAPLVIPVQRRSCEVLEGRAQYRPIRTWSFHPSSGDAGAPCVSLRVAYTTSVRTVHTVHICMTGYKMYSTGAFTNFCLTFYRREKSESILCRLWWASAACGWRSVCSTDRGEPNYCPSATMCTSNLKWSGLGSNSVREMKIKVHYIQRPSSYRAVNTPSRLQKPVS